MDLQQLLALLGVATVTDAAVMINRFNTFLAFVMSVTGTPSAEEALDRVKAELSITKDIRAALGVVSASEIMGKLSAMVTSAQLATSLQSELATMRKAAEDKTAAELMDRASREGRLSPAARKSAEQLNEKYGIDALKAFIEALPAATIASTALVQTLPEPATTSDLEGADVAKIARLLGKDPKDVLSAHKAWTETRGSIDEAAMRRADERQRAS